MQTVSIIIVNWNTRAYLQQCLASIRSNRAPCVIEIIVVDNDSSDGSTEMVASLYPEVVLIRAGENLGFARANNLAFEHARGSLFALVNSDALVHPGCIEILADYLDAHADAGLVGPRVVGRDGRLQRTCRRLPTLWNTACRATAIDRLLPHVRTFSGYELPDEDHERLAEVEVLSGCFCVARRSTVEQVGGLDGRFFFYGEDIDWCKRIGDAGWRRVFVPGATATHFGGGGTSQRPLRFSVEILRATLQYWRKHHGVAGQFVCRALLVAHHGSRLVLRGTSRLLGGGRSADSVYKLKEDSTCLRWLFRPSAHGLKEPAR